MYYGDGRSTFNPLASLDVCGHEIGHAVCEHTCNLTYQGESGALNEGFSDIWGAHSELATAFTLTIPGKSTWLIGEEVMRNGGALRSMQNPNLYWQPDTYKGTHWANTASAWDNGGVHTNSGVLNFWFYLLSVGGSGTNDKGNAYSVPTIGMGKAARIAYATEQQLSPSSNFSVCRSVSIQMAKQLYGTNSAEARAVAAAWYAVGVGPSIAWGTGTSRFIDNVTLNQLFRNSGYDNGYFDGSTAGVTVPVINRCATQTMIYSAGFVGAPVAHYWNVWVDFNRDNEFIDPNERVVVNRASATANGLISSFAVPQSAVVGPARMRVAMSAGQLAASSVGNIGVGEVEDYTVTIAAALAVGTPNPSAGSIGTSSATISWPAITTAATYTVRYRMAGSLSWLTVTSTTLSRALTGLQSGKQYQYTVQAANACGTTGIASASRFFTTLIRGRARPAPADSAVSDSIRATLAATAEALAAARTAARPEAAATAATATAYPNPAADVVHLTLADAQAATEQPIASVEEFDQRGARLATVPFDAATATLRVSGLTPGLYSAVVRGAGRTGAVRFVKE